MIMQIHSQGKRIGALKRLIFTLLPVLLAIAAPPSLRASCGPPNVFAGYIDGAGFNVGGNTECIGDAGAVWVEWGTTTNYGNKSSTFTIGPGIQSFLYSATFYFGGPTAIMHYRAVGYDTVWPALGTNVTGDQAFLTDGWVVITNQPQSQTAGIGSNVTFRVGVMSSPDMGSVLYQWSKNGTAITNATSSTLTLTNAQPTNSGNYSVQAENGGGFWQYSSPAVLTVTAPSLTARLSGTNIVLSWPVAASGYTLESSANFGTNSWTAVTLPVVTNSSAITTTVPVSGPKQFYRLHHY